MGIFDKEKSVSKKDVWSVAEKDKGYIPTTGGRKFNMAQRKKLIRKAFPRFGSQGSVIQKREYGRALKNLESERMSKKRAGDVAGERSVKRELRYLAKLGGGRFGKKY